MRALTQLWALLYKNYLLKKRRMYVHTMISRALLLGVTL